MTANKRAGYCARCGALVKAGAGLLLRRYDDAEDRMVWDVVHPDPAVCKQVIARQQERDALRREYERKLQALREVIRREGERPNGPLDFPSGETVVDTFNIYGGGEAIVVDAQYVWHIENNGMDGDDWALNNVCTGGAGGIGYRARKTDALVAECKALGELAARLKAEGNES